jgi:RHS repeat-associated protein
VTQVVADETAAAPGGVLLSWSIPLDETTLASGLVVEELQAGTGWTPVPAGELVLGHRPDDGVSTGDDSTHLRILLASGWERGTSYRIRLSPALTDRLGRSYGEPQDLQWTLPAAPSSGPAPPVQYDQRFPTVYESYDAAGATAGGRFPAGQSRLFQGLWTDPVTGMAYARARWYDARNAHWLSEDPLGAVDSTNLYAFVGWQPNMGRDPLGLRDPTEDDLATQQQLQKRLTHFEWTYAEQGRAQAAIFDAGYDYLEWWSTEKEYYLRNVLVEADDEASFRAIRTQLQKDLDTYVAAVAEADKGGAIQYSYLGNFYTYTQAEKIKDNWIQAMYLGPILAGDIIAVVGAPVVMKGAQADLVNAIELSARRPFYRYVGEGEAEVIRNTGRIPNVDAEGNPKTVFLSDRDYTTAGRAKTHLQLPSEPAFKVEVDPLRIPYRSPISRVDPNAHPEWGIGGGTESTTINGIDVDPSTLVPLKGGGSR